MGDAAPAATQARGGSVPLGDSGGRAGPREEAARRVQATREARNARARQQIWNLPNLLTMLRIAVVPVLLFMPAMLGPVGSAVLAWIFILATVTDVVDGWLARRGQQVTNVGKLLDPLADKMLVATSLIMLVSVGRIETLFAWMVVVIIGRELAVTGLRSIASAGGQVVAASWLGKAKTLCQNVAIAALLFHYPTLGLPAHELGLSLLGVATLLTLWSGYAYFAAYFRELLHS